MALKICNFKEFLNKFKTLKQTKNTSLLVILKMLTLLITSSIYCHFFPYILTENLFTMSDEINLLEPEKEFLSCH